MFFFKQKNEKLAIDIGDVSIEALLLKRSSRVHFYQRIELPENTVTDGIITQEGVFVSSLKTLAENYRRLVYGNSKKLIPANLSLPESKVFIHCFDITLSDGEDLKKKIDIEAQKIIPWQKQEMYADFFSTKDKDIYHIMYAAAPRELVNKYKKTFKDAGFELYSVGPESLALGRALISGVPEKNAPRCILDIGARTTNISVFRGDLLALSVSAPIAGQEFTKAIAEDRKLSLIEAEDLKKGGEDMFEDKNALLYPALHIQFKKFSVKVQEVLLYFEKKTGAMVDEVILAGGSSLLNGFDVFLSKELNKKTVLGNPLQNIGNVEVFGDGAASIFFADVIGQALNAMDNKAEKINLSPSATLASSV